MRSLNDVAREALAQALPESVAVLETEGAGAVVRLRTGERIPVLVRWAGAGYPRDVDRALRSGPTDRPLLLVAEAISPGAREMLAERGVGWVGLDGSMLIELDGKVYIERRTAAVDAGARRTAAVRWTPSTADVAETLLSSLVPTESGRPAGHVVPLVQNLAGRSARSLGAVSRALRDFEDQGWIVPSDEGTERSRGRRPARRIEDPGALLDAWAGYERALSGDRGFHVLERDPETTAARIAELFGDDVVFGGLLAADRIAPYSTGISVVRCHIDGRIGSQSFDELAREAGLTPTKAGARVVVSTARPPVFTASTVDSGLRIVDPIRAYVDLLRDSIRGEEPAEHLRRLAIGF